MSWGKRAGACVLIWLCASCGSGGGRQNPTTLRDTTGLVVPWDCSASGCEVGNAPNAFATCDQASAYWGYVGRLFYVCASTITAGTDFNTKIDDCRATVCASDDDCPYMQGYDYRCRSGLCYDAAFTVVNDSSDIVALCLGATPRPTDCNANDPAVTALFAANCVQTETTSTCTVPPSCAQP